MSTSRRNYDKEMSNVPERLIHKKLQDKIRSDLLSDGGWGPSVLDQTEKSEQQEEDKGQTMNEDIQIYVFTVTKKQFDRISKSMDRVDARSLCDVIISVYNSIGMKPEEGKNLIEELCLEGHIDSDELSVYCEWHKTYNKDEIGRTLNSMAHCEELRGCRLAILFSIGESTELIQHKVVHDYKGNKYWKLSVVPLTKTRQEKSEDQMNFYVFYMTDEQHEHNYERFRAVLENEDTDDVDVLCELAKRTGLDPVKVCSYIVRRKSSVLFELLLVKPGNILETFAEMSEIGSYDCHACVSVCAGEKPGLFRLTKLDDLTSLEPLVLLDEEPDEVTQIKETEEGKEDTMEKVMEKITSNIKDTGSELSSAGLEGLKQAGAQEVSDRMISIVRSRIGDAYPELLNGTLGKKAEPLIIAGVVHLAAGVFSEKVPQAENLRLNCKRVVTAEMKDNGREFLSVVVPLLAELSDAMPMVSAELGGKGIETAEVTDEPTQKKTKKSKK